MTRPGAEDGPGPTPAGLTMAPLDVSVGLRRMACDAIKRAITDMDIYSHAREINTPASPDRGRMSTRVGLTARPNPDAG